MAQINEIKNVEIEFLDSGKIEFADLPGEAFLLTPEVVSVVVEGDEGVHTNDMFPLASVRRVTVVYTQNEPENEPQEEEGEVVFDSGEISDADITPTIG